MDNWSLSTEVASSIVDAGIIYATTIVVSFGVAGLIKLIIWTVQSYHGSDKQP